MLLMIDNYDSFTYNLVQYFGELGQDLKVYRNNKITLPEIERMKPDRIVVSPGPCTPKEAGISIDVIRHFTGRIPVLGVCLGHQAIGDAFGGDVIRAPYLMHGKTSMIHHDGRTIFAGLPNPFEATRYHSLIIKRETMPSVLEVSAWTEDGIVIVDQHAAHERLVYERMKRSLNNGGVKRQALLIPEVVELDEGEEEVVVCSFGGRI
jgi:anthranilate synthase/aminodeoxychorismate synthase-like glutamine amidotransferase